MSLSQEFLRRKSIHPRVAAGDGKPSLRRTLGPIQLIFLGVGAIIGTGIFVLTSEAAQSAGPAMVLSFVLAGIVCAAAGLCYAEMAAIVPVTGSAYAFSYIALGEGFAWAVGWSITLEYAISAAATAVAWSNYMVGMATRSFGFEVPLALTRDPASGGIINLPAVFVTITLTGLLLIGTGKSARFNAALVLLKLATLSVFIAVCSRHVDLANFHPMMPMGMSGVVVAASTSFFAFIGFDAVATATEETINPQRNIPIGILGSLAACAVIYVAVAVMVTGTLGAQPLFGPDHRWLVPGSSELGHRCLALQATGHEPLVCSREALAHVLREIGYPGFATFIGIVVGLALPSVLLLNLYGQSRIFFAMSRDGLLPVSLSKINRRFGTPHRITLITGFVVTLAAAFLPVGQLAQMVNAGTLFAFIMVALATYRMRKLYPDMLRPFKAPWFPLVMLAAIGGCGVMLITLPIMGQTFFVVWSVIGMLYYLTIGRRTSLGRHDPA